MSFNNEDLLIQAMLKRLKENPEQANLFLKVLVTYVYKKFPEHIEFKSILRKLDEKSVYNEDDSAVFEELERLWRAVVYVAQEKIGVKSYSSGQIARFLGVSITTVNKWIKTGRLVGIERTNPNKQIRIPENTLWETSDGEMIEICEIIDKYKRLHLIEDEESEHMVWNELKIIGTDEQVKEVMDFIKPDHEEIGVIDFNKIIPIPRWIYGVAPNVNSISSSDIEKWGIENTIIGWTKKNWGITENAHSIVGKHNADGVIKFATIRYGVPNLIQKIAWIFPEVTLVYKFADEDLGNGNCGFYRFKENKLESIHYKPGSKGAYELAFDLHNSGLIPSWYIFNEELNTYELKEDVV